VGQNASGSAAVALGTTDGGTIWTSQKLPSGDGNLDAVACPAVSVCEAAGAGASTFRTTDGGAIWVAETLPPGVGYVDGAACAATSGCIGVGSTAASTVVLKHA
jgi:photosystem II stability/assembly factor-like uncharacterized protein